MSISITKTTKRQGRFHRTYCQCGLFTSIPNLLNCKVVINYIPVLRLHLKKALAHAVWTCLWTPKLGRLSWRKAICSFHWLFKFKWWKRKLWDKSVTQGYLTRKKLSRDFTPCNQLLCQLSLQSGLKHFSLCSSYLSRSVQLVDPSHRKTGSEEMEKWQRHLHT